MQDEVRQLPIIQELMTKQKKCMEAHEQRNKDGVVSFFTSGPRHSPFVPMIIKEAKGCRFIDLDGNEFIDTAMSYGPLILGHAPDVVVKAVQEALNKPVCVPEDAQTVIALGAAVGARRKLEKAADNDRDEDQP